METDAKKNERKAPLAKIDVPEGCSCEVGYMYDEETGRWICISPGQIPTESQAPNAATLDKDA